MFLKRLHQIRYIETQGLREFLGEPNFPGRQFFGTNVSPASGIGKRRKLTRLLRTGNQQILCLRRHIEPVERAADRSPGFRYVVDRPDSWTDLMI